MPQEIHVLDGKVRLLQPDGGFRTSLDSVMLAAAVPAVAGDSVLDLGCGVGGAAFCLNWRIPELSITGIDINADYIALADANNFLNASRLVFETTGVGVYRQGEKPAFKHVMLNPPYFSAGAHTRSPDLGRAQANGHLNTDQDIAQWIAAAHRLLKSRGSLTMIYPASGIDRVLQSFGRRFGAVEIIPLWPRAGVEAKRVIIRAIKDRRTPARFHAGIVLHRSDGGYTKEADAVLRDGNKI